MLSGTCFDKIGLKHLPCCSLTCWTDISSRAPCGADAAATGWLLGLPRQRGWGIIPHSPSPYQPDQHPGPTPHRHVVTAVKYQGYLGHQVLGQIHRERPEEPP